MKRIIVLSVILLVCNFLSFAQNWNILDKSMSAWNVDGGAATNKAWLFSKSSQGSVPASAVTQENGYVNISKTHTFINYNYAFLVPPAVTLSSNTAYTFEVKARINPINKTTFPDITPPSSGEGGFESNQISARLNSKNMAIHLKYGTEGQGYMSLQAGVTHSNDEKYLLNTAEWHVYRFVFHADNTKYDVYLDELDDPIFENVPTTSGSGTNILRLGAETFHRCNMDIEYAKMGTGDFSSKSKITSVEVSSDSHVANHERTISVTVNTALIDNSQPVLVSLIDANGNTIVNAVEATVQSNKATTNFTIPASVGIGKYFIQAAVPGGKIGDISVTPKTIQYVVVDESPLDTKLLPQVTPVGFITAINEYQYKAPSNEYIFPSVLDTKDFTVNGKFLNNQDTLGRYYRFYTPHENPGGMFLATAPTLDGPWTERNTVIDLNWAKAVSGSNVNTADHISACQVVWNEVYNKYFMYFHGPNTTTHYATSDNMVDWTFGASILNAQHFGTKGNEASYAKVFEHAVPGLNNKYILMLMIAESNMRKIYWAHSPDGIEWTCIKKPLISPDLNFKKIPGTDIKPSYWGSFGNNVSAPAFMKSNDRYFVFFHGSKGNICVAEVGESLDMEVHWGESLKAADVIIDKDINGNPIAVPRVAAPVFLKNDQGKWYMFFEAGGRLGANVAYAKEIATSPNSTTNHLAESITVYPGITGKNETINIRIPSGESLPGTCLVKLTTLTGTSVLSRTLTSTETSIPAPGQAGIYIVQVRTGNGITKSTKIIIH